MRLSSLLVMLAFVAACSSSGDILILELPKRRLAVVSMTPSVIVSDDRVTIRTENGCGARLSLTANDEVIPVEAVDANTFTFAPPAWLIPEACTGVPTQFVWRLTCKAPPDMTFVYEPGGNTAEAGYVLDPSLVPDPTIATWTPIGTAPADVARVTVRFTQLIDPSTVTASTLGIEGVEGTIVAEPGDRTFSFVPTTPLAPGGHYTAFVGDVSARKCGRHLKHTLGADPARDTWSFDTFAASWSRPRVVAHTPEDGTGFTPEKVIHCTATFDRDMDAESLKRGFAFLSGDTPAYRTAVTWDPETKTASLDVLDTVHMYSTWRCAVLGSSLPEPPEGAALARSAAGEWMADSVSWVVESL